MVSRTPYVIYRFGFSYDLHARMKVYDALIVLIYVPVRSSPTPYIAVGNITKIRDDEAGP